MSRILAALTLLVAGPAPAQGLDGSGVTWFLFSPETAEWSAAAFRLEPGEAQGEPLQISCTIARQEVGLGPVEGHCRLGTAAGDGWDETFRCDRPDLLPAGLVPGGWADGCMGQITIQRGSGQFQGLTGHGLLRQSVLARLPDGRVIGMMLRSYEGD